MGLGAQLILNAKIVPQEKAAGHKTTLKFMELKNMVKFQAKMP